MKKAGKAESTWFLAEMAVSEQHGGGVTLCRTFGRNMDNFDGMFCLSDFHDVAPHLRERSVKWMPFFRSNFCRGILGCRLSEWCFRQTWAENWHARQCARRIHDWLPSDGPKPLFLTSPQTTLAIRTMEKLKSLRSLSYVTWIMDDNWVQGDERSKWSYSPRVEVLLRTHLRNAEMVLTISQQMGEHYKRLFGVDFEVLFAPSPKNEIRVPLDFVPNRKLAYCGSLSIWPGDALSRLIPFLPELGYSLDIYSHHSLPSNLQHSHVRKLPPLPAEDVQATMSKYDAVLLPIGFTSATSSYTNFNIATKMAECLGSGTVTIAIGPENAAMIRYFRTHNLGVCVSDVSLPKLRQAFQLVESLKMRNQRIENDLAHVQSHLTQERVFKHWRAIRDRISPTSYF
ncbi:glycosyltransferase family protein [Prosthecobacter vanneervenii]|uniref:Uncharacterized protein n=1 Tax=Prosthecobacter vanneervenii TaxID=48466 RepID=A0A7W7Y7E7_9BACT|nr:hypothetical protein [Prosthecobacter vanneervenii]MBB5030971.1 hypothetical protein [Prosthecobacter vanneervenii]